MSLSALAKVTTFPTATRQVNTNGGKRLHGEDLRTGKCTLLLQPFTHLRARSVLGRFTVISVCGEQHSLHATKAKHRGIIHETASSAYARHSH